MRLPTRLDRYPAKMVSKLADRLIQKYAQGAKRILDPFCGSGAVLVAAQRQGLDVSGIDVNPVAALLCRVKLNSFDVSKAKELAAKWIRMAQTTDQTLPIDWDGKRYWFTPRVIFKFERLRFIGQRLQLSENDEGIVLLLCYSLAVRLCSRADQRSPKPFISKRAKESRKGRHFDPYRTIIDLLKELSELYGNKVQVSTACFFLADLLRDTEIVRRTGKYTHVITSPPYINAQDYFRNFKLELYLLEGILPFSTEDLRERFIGTERGNLLRGISSEMLASNIDAVPQLKALERVDARLAAVVHRYFHDMARAFDILRDCLESRGNLVLVCGDNLVGGIRIPTWRVLQCLLEERDFCLFDRFKDPIGDRLLAPKRSGHKGLIKEEVVSAYRRI